MPLLQFLQEFLTGLVDIPGTQRQDNIVRLHHAPHRAGQGINIRNKMGVFLSVQLDLLQKRGTAYSLNGTLARRINFRKQ